MKRLLLIVLLIAAIQAGAQDFRDAKWGMSVKEVLELENENAKVVPSSYGVKLIVSEEEFLDKAIRITYTFGNDGLVVGSIRIPTDVRPWFMKKIRERYGQGFYLSEQDRWSWISDQTAVWIDYLNGQTVLTYCPRWLLELASTSPK
jgi:hypothetical protein